MLTLVEGILLVNKSKGRTAFSLVAQLRKVTRIQKIGHAGTLDPFATGLMVLLIGKNYTRKSDLFLNHDKEYVTTVKLGTTTDTFDCEGVVQSQSDYIPTLEEVENALQHFQGKVLQTPPMFSAKKKEGKKLYELARKGITIEREPVEVTLNTQLLSYEYPYLKLHVQCSKGTYVRAIGYDLGQMLGCGAHLQELIRLRSGPFHLEDAIDGDQLDDFDSIKLHLRQD